MTADNTFPITGVDGGGTGCRGRHICADGRVIEAKIEGSSNVQSSFDTAITNLNALLEKLAAGANCHVADLLENPIHLGLAGVLDESYAAKTAAALGLKPHQISEDKPTGLYGALGERSGIVAALGTGSYIAADFNGDAYFLGGYALALGDQASGAWLGRAAMRSTLMMIDEIMPFCPMGQHILDHFAKLSGKTAPKAIAVEIVDFAATANPREYAGFAPMVIEAANSGSSEAQKYMREGADYVAHAVAALSRKTDKSLNTLCLIGGIGPHMAPYLPTELQNIIAQPMGNALDGAMQLAAKQMA